MGNLGGILLPATLSARTFLTITTFSSWLLDPMHGPASTGYGVGLGIGIRKSVEELRALHPVAKSIAQSSSWGIVTAVI